MIWIHYTGYLYKVHRQRLSATTSKYYAPAAIITGLLVLVVGVVGYIVGQRQHGKPFTLAGHERGQALARGVRADGASRRRVAGD